ncbi:hypothetical protein PXJ67_11850 [Mycobacteroides chelonae]|uniref:hypothetical protein n=1 Tax=Mycobacteroides chelonae TaxID=1774 RepID=UPI00095A18FE|nr:hypothetical protein [Mycobacteroides chelonae]OLT84036.1 hypothetical protein BKG57_04035 [Mycobacteroides chelonae]WED94027.1 hypothetical protein PXJ67_11850 [Mycobacteroides chelonae]WED98150.1 hypothetical protein PYW02_06605 [Mycobacteroides chelonae]
MHETESDFYTTEDEYVPTWRRPITSEADDREAAFQRYLESSEPYFDAVDAAGHTAWHHGDIEARRALFYRRYLRTNNRVAV